MPSNGSGSTGRDLERVAPAVADFFTQVVCECGPADTLWQRDMKSLILEVQPCACMRVCICVHMRARHEGGGREREREREVELIHTTSYVIVDSRAGCLLSCYRQQSRVDDTSC